MKPTRIQRKRTKGWRMPENTVYVGRGSKWGNPFIVGKPIQRIYYRFEFDIDDRIKYVNGAVIENNDEAVRLYKKYSSYDKLNLSELKGKNLACWCPLDKPCHADILLELLQRDE